MENKKTIIGIIILVILIVAIGVIAYFFNNFNSEQMKLLSEETNKILKSDIANENISFSIKTKKNYAVVEKAVKEYVSNLKNIYVEINELNSGINPNNIFSSQNMQDKDLKAVEEIISEYKEKGQNCVSELQNLTSESKITENIEDKNISNRKDYYKKLYSTIMLNDSMKAQYASLNEKVKDENSKLNEKIAKIEKIKKFLVDNKSSWEIKEDKIQFTNLNRMTEYYSLLNQFID